METVSLNIKGVEYSIEEAKEIHIILKDFFENKGKKRLYYEDMVDVIGSRFGVRKLYYSCLNNKIRTVEDLTKFSAGEFLRLPRVGRKTLFLAKEYLCKLDLKFS